MPLYEMSMPALHSALVPATVPSASMMACSKKAYIWIILKESKLRKGILSILERVYGSPLATKS